MGRFFRAIPSLAAGLVWITTVPHPRDHSAIAQASAPPGQSVTTPDATPPAMLADRVSSCHQPRLVPASAPGCRGDRLGNYPRCRWRLPKPSESEGLFRMWRNSALELWWGRPALVSLVMASALEYQKRYPGEQLVVGDLDAPGPRHQTHDQGVDVDLYLPGHMFSQNFPGEEYIETYTDLSSLQVASSRMRVLTLAKIIARCSDGRARFYYNDPVVIDAFNTWFRAQAFEPLPSPWRTGKGAVGAPMVPHNDLHLFHFHVSIPKDAPLIPWAP